MILSYTDTARLHKTTWPTVTPVDKLIQAKATHKKNYSMENWEWKRTSISRQKMAETSF